MQFESDPGEISPGYFYARKTAIPGFYMPGEVMPGFLLPGTSVLCRAFFMPGTRREKRMHTERTQYATTSIPMHSNRLMKLTETGINLLQRTVRICIDCVEWIWGYTKRQNNKPITSIRTLEMSPELRETCFNTMKERGRF